MWLVPGPLGVVLSEFPFGDSMGIVLIRVHGGSQWRCFNENWWCQLDWCAAVCWIFSAFCLLLWSWWFLCDLSSCDLVGKCPNLDIASYEICADLTPWYPWNYYEFGLLFCCMKLFRIQPLRYSNFALRKAAWLNSFCWWPLMIGPEVPQRIHGLLALCFTTVFRSKISLDWNLFGPWKCSLKFIVFSNEKKDNIKDNIFRHSTYEQSVLALHMDLRHP